MRSASAAATPTLLILASAALVSVGAVSAGPAASEVLLVAIADVPLPGRTTRVQESLRVRPVTSFRPIHVGEALIA